MLDTDEMEWMRVAAALVLEGGGTRGAYTAGVLDVFLENEIAFGSVYGVSAGACNAMSYISGQHGRNRIIFQKYVCDDRYLSISNLRKTGSLFGFGFIFGEMSHELLPFDYDTFFASPVDFRVGATNIDTGKAVFFSKEDLRKSMDAVRASASLPMVSPIVEFNGYRLLDGGVSDPIPVERSMLDGNERNVLVLTRDATYRKSARPEFPLPVIKAVYRKYPKLVEALVTRSERYNSQLELCRRLENQGKVFIIRPSSPVLTSRYEKDPVKLMELYDRGVRDARRKRKELQRFLQK